MIKTFVKVFLLLFLSLFLYGNIYFWTDENGTKHFSNTTAPLDEAVEELTESRAVLQQLTAEKNNRQVFKVLRVFDGDTIKVSGLDLIFKIRLVGIDSPEIGFKGQKSQPFSQKAKQYLAGLVDNKNITLKSYGIGGYNRQLAEVFIGNKNVNIAMVRAGLAEVYKGRRPKNLDFQAYITEESKARQSRKGMWIQKASYKSPKQWRKEHPRK
ncbi:thermonuclease family protein [Desulfobacula phenolica]|uniref:Endonuclease YncB, thermonuclease family n=1 Tax=Desulfobacula phenolica TaxID=90732 RepID=A0A1H2JHM6_9BACT|nr:thermonuclease family protein [Desulfobacula phenolica]SDU55565.1 Endonuclease YncB, thermonuclease family [Desulfobacula phenolica]